MSDDTNKPTDISAKIAEKDRFAAAIEQMKREFPNQIEFHRVMAGLRWKVYQQHLKEGFSPEQALTIVIQKVN